MADEAPNAPEGAASEGGEDDKRVPYERFQQANAKARAEAQRASALEQEMATLRQQMEERETAGLPELERERKRAEQLEKRAAEAEKRAEAAETARVRSGRERFVLAAAAQAGFDDPSDALRFSEYVDLDQIEDRDAAEKAVKKLAKAKPRLLKEGPAPVLPGRVLENGRGAEGKAQSAGMDALIRQAAGRSQ